MATSKIAKISTGHPTDVLDVQAVADILGCTPRTVSQMLCGGEIRGRKSGKGVWRIVRQAVLDYLYDKSKA